MLVHYRVFADPTDVSRHDFQQAAYQAVLRTRLRMLNPFQPYGCANTLPQTEFPDDPNLTRMSQTLGVAIVRCPGSNWLPDQPGALLVWRDAYGIHVVPIFGAQWRLYQVHYQTLGKPTSVPYLLYGRSNDPVIQDFGVGHRVVGSAVPGSGEGLPAKASDGYGTLPLQDYLCGNGPAATAPGAGAAPSASTD